MHQDSIIIVFGTRLLCLTFGARQNVQNTLANNITIPIAPAKILLNLPNVAILFADEFKFELLESVTLELGEGVVLAVAFELLDVAAAEIVADAAELFAVEDPRVADVAAAGIVADAAELFAVEEPAAAIKLLDVAATGVVANAAELFAVEDPAAVFKVLDVAAPAAAAELVDPPADPDPDAEPIPPKQPLATPKH